MLIKYQELAINLQKSCAPFYLLTGTELFLMNDVASQIINKANSAASFERTVIDVNNPKDWENFTFETNCKSLFSQNKILDIRFNKKNIDKSGVEAINSYMQSANHDIIVLIRAPNLITKSHSWLTKRNDVLAITLYPLTGKYFTNWLNEQIYNKGLKFTKDAAKLFDNHMQGKMLRASQIVEKLSLLPDTTITVELLTKQLTEQSDFELYALGDAIIKEDVAKSLQIIRQHREQGSAANLVLWAISKEVRQLIQLQHLLQCGEKHTKACNQLKIWPFQSKFYLALANKITAKSIYAILKKCHELDKLLRSSNQNLVWLEFERLIISLSTKDVKDYA